MRRQRPRQHDSDRAWLLARLTTQLKQPEYPTLLEDVAPDIALSLLGELLIAQTLHDRRTQRWRWEAHKMGELDISVLLMCLFCWPVGLVLLFGRRHTPKRLFTAHTPAWHRLAALVQELLGRSRTGDAVRVQLDLLRRLNSNECREEAPLEAALTHSLVRALPFLTPEELAALPESCWEFLETAIVARGQVGWQQRLPWMKADFVVAALLALDLAQRPTSQAAGVLLHDREERVREAARELLRVEPEG